jgi:CDGSH-type Zn-finger protein
VLRDRAGNDLEPALDPEVAVIPGGPLWVRGGIAITSADGTQWEVRNRVALCRCGASKNKPFCDRSHETIHFDER